MLMNEHDDTYVDAMLMVNMQANTRSVTIMIFIESIVEGVKGQRKSGVWILIRHPCSLFFGQTLIKGLKKSADLIFIASSVRQDYDSFTIV